MSWMIAQYRDIARSCAIASIFVVASAAPASAAHTVSASTAGTLSITGQVAAAISFTRVAAAASPGSPVVSVTLPTDAAGGTPGNATASHVVIASSNATWQLRANMASDLVGGSGLSRSAIEIQGPDQAALAPPNDWVGLSASDVTLHSGIAAGATSTSGEFKLRLNAPDGQAMGDYSGSITFTLAIP